jgi:long-subunit acyl-CoA synthetase (AMP-forming)
VWEKFEEKMKDLAASKPQIVQNISGWAKNLGAQQVQANMKKKDGPLCFNVANFLILKRIKQALGLDQAKVFIYGAAPLKQSTNDYFASLSMPLFNCYGMSETTA